jgi:dTDP-4-amino-4,6-dideoxygalactose transaminase
VTGHRIPVFKPLLPTAAQIAPYLERIDEARWYTNFGPLANEFEERLADHFGLPSGGVALVANGTMALATALATAPPGLGAAVPMPSWTFPATALAALAAAAEPCLLDINAESWALTPSDIPAELAARSRAAMPVAPFGADPQVGTWVKWTQTTSVPVVIDAATCFDRLRLVRLPERPPIALAVSLHATKVFGVGEGGIVVSNDADWIRRIHQYINFGFYGARRADVLGINAKLSEYGAAVGLAALDAWPGVRQRWVEVAEKFSARLRGLGIRAQPGFGETAVANCVIELEDSGVCDRAVTALEAAGIDTRRWWGLGQHENPALRFLERSVLDVTGSLARRTIGLPFWIDINSDEIEAVFSVLSKVCDVHC